MRPSLKPLILILVVGTLFRLALAFLHPFYFPDSADYEALGRALASGASYVAGGMQASRMPGYPLFLAGCAVLSGGSLKLAFVIQAVIGALIGVWVYLLCADWDRRWGLIAAAVAAIDPLSVAFSAALLSETTFTFFLLGALVALQRLGRSTNRFPLGWSVWLIIAWPCAVYLRPSVLWCAIPIVAWHLWLAWRKRDGVQLRATARLATVAAAALLATALTLIPWWQRNYALFHTGYFRMTTLDGKFLYESLSPQTTGKPAMQTIVTPSDMRALNEGAQADEFKRRAWSFVRADPWRQVRMAFVKAGRTWNPLLNADEFQSFITQILFAAWHIPLYLLALLGVWCLRRQAWRLGVLLWPLAYFTAVHVIYLGSVRYRVPLMPLLCILAAQGVLFFLDRWKLARGA
jgi:hypothetical protein